MKIFKRDTKANDPYEGIECGDKVRDTITGYEGVCIGRIEYISGCNQIPRSTQGGATAKSRNRIGSMSSALSWSTKHKWPLSRAAPVAKFRPHLVKVRADGWVFFRQ